MIDIDISTLKIEPHVVRNEHGIPTMTTFWAVPRGDEKPMFESKTPDEVAHKMAAARKERRKKDAAELETRDRKATTPKTDQPKTTDKKGGK